jgi:hypothetical protein
MQNYGVAALLPVISVLELAVANLCTCRDMDGGQSPFVRLLLIAALRPDRRVCKSNRGNCTHFYRVLACLVLPRHTAAAHTCAQCKFSYNMQQLCQQLHAVQSYAPAVTCSASSEHSFVTLWLRVTLRNHITCLGLACAHAALLQAVPCAGRVCAHDTAWWRHVHGLRWGAVTHRGQPIATTVMVSSELFTLIALSPSRATLDARPVQLAKPHISLCLASICSAFYPPALAHMRHILTRTTQLERNRTQNLQPAHKTLHRWPSSRSTRARLARRWWSCSRRRRAPTPPPPQRCWKRWLTSGGA